MMHLDRRTRALATSFSGVAGYVDAIGFLVTGGFFVSFMSGNSTRMGIGLAQGSMDAAFAAAMVGTFVIGVMAGAITGRIAKAYRRPAVLCLVTLLLALAVLMHGLGAGVSWPSKGTVTAQTQTPKLGAPRLCCRTPTLTVRRGRRGR
ncbi:DUF1275 family protein [Brevundimonas sp.]